MRNIIKLIIFCYCLFAAFSCSLYSETLEIAKNSNLDITVEPGKYWFHEFKIMGLFKIKAEPQIAVWIEDEDGKYLKTVYITAKYSSQGLLANKTRPETLPIWKSKYDSRDKKEIDAVSQATGTSLKGKIDWGKSEKKQFLMLEINNSYDYNEFYKDDLSEDQPEFSETSGQPALIYKSEFDNKKDSGSFDLVGHSNPSGKDNKIYTDLNKVTTAKQIAKSIIWKIK